MRSRSASSSASTLALVARGTLSGYLSLRRATTAWCSPARGALGSIVGGTLEDIPATRRFFLGGGGSIRGYEYRTVGPRIDGEVVGGLSFWEASVELRFRVTDTIGIVPFIDAGAAYEDSIPDFSEEHPHRRRHRAALLHAARAAPLRRGDAAQPGRTAIRASLSMSDWDRLSDDARTLRQARSWSSSPPPALAAGAALAQDGERRNRASCACSRACSRRPTGRSRSPVLRARSPRTRRSRRITVSDAEGVWLEIEGVEVVWTRTALFRRMLDIDSLTAERVTMLRKPAAGRAARSATAARARRRSTSPSTPSPCRRSRLPPPVAGAEAQLSAAGSARSPRRRSRRSLAVAAQGPAGHALRRSPPRAGRERADRRPAARRAGGRPARRSAGAARPPGGHADARRRRAAARLAGQSRDAGGRRARARRRASRCRASKRLPHHRRSRRGAGDHRAGGLCGAARRRQPARLRRRARRRRRDRRSQSATLRSDGRRPCRERRADRRSRARERASSRCGSARPAAPTLPFVPGDVSVASLERECRARRRRGGAVARRYQRRGRGERLRRVGEPDR